MSTNLNDPVTLAMVDTELAANFIVDALHDRDIDAEAAGIHTSGFRAEAPGKVRILVHGNDLARARQVLAEYEKEQSEIDWSQVDVGDPET